MNSFLLIGIWLTTSACAASSPRSTEATAVVASRALNGAIEPAITFHVDHPFLLVIKTPGGAILFLGQVEKPDS